MTNSDGLQTNKIPIGKGKKDGDIATITGTMLKIERKN